MMVFFHILAFLELLLVGLSSGGERAIAWNPEVYPKVQCHKGYESSTPGEGEDLLDTLATINCPESMVGCYKRCIFEYLGILQENSHILPGKEHYGKLYFEPEDWITENLNSLLFTRGESDSGKNIAKKVLSDCKEIADKLNGLPKPATCRQQNELYMCMEKAMNCPGKNLQKGTLMTKVCAVQIHEFHYSAQKPDEFSRMYNESYPDVTCHKTYDSKTATALAILSRFCSRSLRGCFKRCMLERLGVLEYIMQPKHSFYSMEFRNEAEMSSTIQFYLFPKAGPDVGLNIAKKIAIDCEDLMDNFHDLTSPPSCQQENDLYMCIEKALGCPELTLQTGQLLTKICTLEQVEYYFKPDEGEDNSWVA